MDNISPFIEIFKKKYHIVIVILKGYAMGRMKLITYIYCLCEPICEQLVRICTYSFL